MTHKGLSIDRDRVRRNTSAEVNRTIDSRIVANIRRYATQPNEVLTTRIRELSREWDIERVLETNASALVLAGLVLGSRVNRRWLLLSGVVAGFLLLHGVQGWCPPLPLLRRVGVRTRTEIDRERLALRYLRGDFTARPTRPPPRERRRLAAIVEEAN